MKSFTDAINENEGLKTFKYTYSIEVEGTVTAHDITEAGELASQETLDACNLNVTKGDMLHIEAVGPAETNMDNLLGQDMDELTESICTSILNVLNEKSSKLSFTEQEVLKQKLISKL